MNMAVWAALSIAAGQGERPVDFREDVRPILSDKCFECHGPDEAAREADLRLDLAEQAFGDLGGYAAVVPGASEESELYLRISDPDDPMPPKGFEKTLTAEEIELLRRWIDEGAPWEEHWAYLPPQRPEPPAVTDAGWAENPVDAFLLARMEAEGLAPAAEATRETLIRRATLDLTGLPPTLREVDAFLKDSAPGAWVRVVDRLLASPRYGEHMARAWLDAARYGDTHGYHLDNERMMWPYRDWVVRAFDENMPFDRFTVEQLAGDLLPEPTLEEKVATGFNRCNPTSAEGGMIAEEFLNIYAADRAVTTATVWMGQTMLCAQCHDHKFDPISQKEFYGFYAFFNSITESASDGNAPSPAPIVKVPSEDEVRELARLDAEVAALEERLAAPMPEVDAAQAEWEARLRVALADRWTVLEPLAATARGGATLIPLEDGSLLATGENPDQDAYDVLLRTELEGITAFRVEALRDESLPEGGPGRAHNANFVLTELDVEVVPEGEVGEYRAVPLEAAFADFEQEGFAVSGTLDQDPTSGWAVHGSREARTAVFAPEEPVGEARGSLLRVRLGFESPFVQHGIGRLRISASTDPALRPAVLGTWHAVGPFAGESGEAALDRDFGPESAPGGAVDLSRTFDGDLSWTERPDLVDGALHMLPGQSCATYLYRRIQAPNAGALSISLGSDDAIRVWLNGELVHESRDPRPLAADQDRVTLALDAGENHLLFKVVNFAGGYGFTMRRASEAPGGLPVDVERALTAAERTEAAAALLRDHYRRRVSPEWTALAEELDSVRVARAEVEDAIPSTLVMEELPEPRPAFVLKRGQYDLPQEEVQPGTPGFLPPLDVPDDRRATRLDLARWLVSPEHPLTARVQVNRLWQGLFGTGLVETSEDFGSQGALPSHPGLLDWLAVELVESGWDVKHVLRLMVTSAAYRQSAEVTPEELALDPRNRLLARGPRYRLDAERIRDSALFVSGLLVEERGGPGVNPYQPPGIWEAVAYTSSNTANYERDDGDALYRRSLYTFWKRTAPPAAMQVFDAPTREECRLRRQRTNTPLQALALMNDVQMVEASRALAERVLTQPGDENARLVRAFRLATARRPASRELAVVRGLLRAQREEFAADPESARALVAEGASEPDPALDPVELAAWTLVGNLLLNLDEFVTKG